MNTLRPYQTRLVDDVRDLVSLWRARVCVQAPTGAGKTLMMAALLADPVAKDDRFPLGVATEQVGMSQLVVTHRRILLDQLSRELNACGIEHGIRAAGHVPNTSAPIQLCMLQSDYARSIKGKKWKLVADVARIHIDEIHTVKGATAQKLLAAYPNASVIGWTATPREIPPTVCDTLIVAATVPELIDGGYLVPPIVFTPTGPDVARLDSMRASVGGDYSPSDVDKLLPRNVILGYVHGHLLRLNPELKPTVCFCGGVPQSLFMAQELTKRGVQAAHIDGKQIWTHYGMVDSTPKHRAELFDMLVRGDMKVVCNRFVLREGWNLPAIEHVVLATSFGSRTTFVQACGRGLRTAPGKTACTFQDHGANFWRFPPLDGDTPWDMTTPERVTQAALDDDRRTPEPKNPEPICCPECTCLRVSGPQCPHCGYRHTTSSKHVMQLSGELVRREGRLYKTRAVRETPGDAETWRRAFWASRKNSPKRSLRQVYTWHARNNNWRWLPKTLPLMPRDDNQELWSAKVGVVNLNELR